MTRSSGRGDEIHAVRRRDHRVRRDEREHVAQTRHVVRDGQLDDRETLLRGDRFELPPAELVGAAAQAGARARHADEEPPRRNGDVGRVEQPGSFDPADDRDA